MIATIAPGHSGRALRMGWAAVLCALLIAGCAPTRGGPVPYDVAGFGRPDLPTPAAAEAAYHIGAGDTLNVSVLNVPEYSGDVVVDQLGRFEMPLVGKVPAQGKTTDELARSLETLLGDRYLKSPKVLVLVKASQSQRVTVDGSVQQAGIYPIAGPTTLIQALALARGLDEDANSRRIVIFRTIGGQRQAAAFDLESIRRGQAPDPEVYGNDVIVVDGSKTRKAFRDFISSIPLFSAFRPF